MTHDEFIEQKSELDDDFDDDNPEMSDEEFELFRQEFEEAHKDDVRTFTDEEIEMFTCHGCKVNTLEINEYYMVQFHIWQTVVPVAYQPGILCIGCLEGYLGRQLVSKDFTEAPVNYCPSESKRLMNRWGQWFRDFDGPFASDEERWAAVKELGNRMDGLVTRNV